MKLDHKYGIIHAIKLCFVIKFYRSLGGKGKQREITTHMVKCEFGTIYQEQYLHLSVHVFFLNFIRRNT